MSAVNLKKSYRCVPTLQQFYSGGPFSVSSDGLFIACACKEAINIVDPANSAIRTRIDGDTEAVTSLVLSPNDKLLFSTGHSRQIRVWDLETTRCVRSWKGHDGPIMGMACHASGGLLATVGSDRKVLVWDVDGGFCTHHFRGHEGVVSSVIFHPDVMKSLLFTGSDDATIRVWDLMKKKCVAKLEKHFSTVTSLAVSEDGWTLISGGRDKVVNLWDLRDYVCKMTIPTFEILEALCIIPSGSRFATLVDSTNQHERKHNGSPTTYFVTVGERMTMRFWNSECAACLYEEKSNVNVDETKRGFTSAVMLPLDKGLLCVTADQQFLFYVPMLSCEKNFHLVMQKRLIGYNEEILDLKFLGEEEKFLVVATNIEQVRVYDLSSMSCSYVLEGHMEIILCLDTCVPSLGTPLIVTGSKDNTVRLWDSESQNCLGIGTGHMGGVGAIAFSRKFKNFFVSGSSDRTIKVWSLDGVDHNMKNPIGLKSKAVVAAHDKDVNSIAVAPNDSLVCSGSEDRTACVWRLPDLVFVVALKGHKRGIWSVEFSPIDQCVLTSSGDKTIKMWAIADGSCLKTFEGHLSTVLKASFLSHGTQFVSCGFDGLVKLWTIKTNECIATYDKHEEKIWALTVGEKTEMLATGGRDALVNLWYDSTACEKEDARRENEERLVRDLEMENAVVDADYSRAIQIACELHRPHKLFQLFSELCRKGDAENHMERAFSAIKKEELSQLLLYIRDWNTKPKMCHVAQFALFRFFHFFSSNQILEVKGIGEILEGLIPYSQRHFGRVDRLVRSTYLVDYTLSRMSVLEPISLSSEPEEVEPNQATALAEPVGSEPKLSGKRKTERVAKVKERPSKKIKDVAHLNVAPISLPA